MRIGEGWDLHVLAGGRPLVLGGVTIPFSLGEDAHSDGDVILHAVIDALFGAAALGDIGTHFPPGDERYRNIPSRQLLRRASQIIEEAGYKPSNVDATVVIQEPKIGPYIREMRENIAADLGIAVEAVSVKAKSAEGTGAVGSGDAVEARAVCLLTEG